jgi:hypothetical protein
MAKRATRRNIWPFGKGQLLGSKTTYRRTRTAGTSRRAVSEKAAARQSKELEAERLHKKFTDAQLDRKLKAHYARGGNLKEFMAMNPASTVGQADAVNLLVIRYGFNLADARKALASWGVKSGGRYSRSSVLAIGKRRNPASAAAEVYEEFHGHPSTKVVKVTSPVHYHEHLAQLGKLAYLKIAGVDGYRHTLKQFKGALLCSNEQRNQLFIEGGDQSLDLSVFGIRSPHELESLGQITEIGYRTTKDHLGKEGGKALYFHKTGDEKGFPPDLLYRVRDQQLEIVGGSYTIEAEGIRN